ncbi:hypothetical protein ABW20_dc0109306 [Dactylellina cionopaga]|nr:hypothetical protein ABW20_dc0109306 [Dactylellina cionopaga]
MRFALFIFVGAAAVSAAPITFGNCIDCTTIKHGSGAGNAIPAGPTDPARPTDPAINSGPRVPEGANIDSIVSAKLALADAIAKGANKDSVISAKLALADAVANSGL